jgi:hypothetical protein
LRRFGSNFQAESVFADPEFLHGQIYTQPSQG